MKSSCMQGIKEQIWSALGNKTQSNKLKIILMYLGWGWEHEFNSLYYGIEEETLP